MTDYPFEVNRVILDAPSCSNCSFLSTDSNCEPVCLMEKKPHPELTPVKDLTFGISFHACSLYEESQSRNELLKKVPFVTSGNGKEILEMKDEFLDTITDLIIPFGIEKIGDDALCNLYNLKRVFIPRSVREIGANAFLDCTKLTEVEIPDSVEKLGSAAFFGCKSLKSVHFVSFPGGKFKIPSVERLTFGDCLNLEKINLPESITEIQSESFMNCMKLKKLRLPENVKTIKTRAFRWTEALEELNLPEKLETVEKEAFINVPLNEKSLAGYKEKFPDFKIIIDNQE